MSKLKNKNPIKLATRFVGNIGKQSYGLVANTVGSAVTAGVKTATNLNPINMLTQENDFLSQFKGKKVICSVNGLFGTKTEQLAAIVLYEEKTVPLVSIIVKGDVKGLLGSEFSIKKRWRVKDLQVARFGEDVDLSIGTESADDTVSFKFSTELNRAIFTVELLKALERIDSIISTDLNIFTRKKLV